MPYQDQPQYPRGRIFRENLPANADETLFPAGTRVRISHILVTSDPGFAGLAQFVQFKDGSGSFLWELSMPPVGSVEMPVSIRLENGLIVNPPNSALRAITVFYYDD